MTQSIPSGRPNLPNRKYRVVQWATGNVGTHSLRSIIQHPQMTLAGLYVHSESKAGRDAGELCGVGPVGIKATRSIDEIVALKPDCVLYMQQGCNFDDLCRLLESGINVVTTRDEVQYPQCMDPVVRQRVEAACQRGKSTLHATGSSPGFISAPPNAWQGRRTFHGVAVIHEDGDERLLDRCHGHSCANRPLANPAQRGSAHRHEARELVRLIGAVRPLLDAWMNLDVLVREVANVLRPRVVENLA